MLRKECCIAFKVELIHRRAPLKARQATRWLCWNEYASALYGYARGVFAPMPSLRIAAGVGPFIPLRFRIFFVGHIADRELGDVLAHDFFEKQRYRQRRRIVVMKRLPP